MQFEPSRFSKLREEGRVVHHLYGQGFRRYTGDVAQLRVHFPVSVVRDTRQSCPSLRICAPKHNV